MMKIAPLAKNEQARLAALRGLDVLDTDHDEKLNDLVKLAAHICQTPLAAISLIDEDRQWVMAITGAEARETSREIAFCSHTILQDGIMLVPDALLDERFFDHPNVACASGVRFYAGVPLATENGENLGSLCVVDIVPRELNQGQLNALKTLADQVMVYLNFRQYRSKLKQYVDDIEQKNTQLRRESEKNLAILRNASDGIHIVDDAGYLIEASDSFCTMLGYSRDELIGKNVAQWDAVFSGHEIVSNIAKQITSQTRSEFETHHRRKDGTVFAVEVSGMPLELDGKMVVFNSSRDITLRKQEEVALQNSNRALAALSSVNRGLMHASDEEALLQSVCQTLVAECGYRLAWVGYLEHDAELSVRPVAQYGFEQGYLESAKIVWADTGRGNGPMGKAARTGKPQIVRNILTDESMLPWREAAIKRGYESGIALPLSHFGKVFGVLSIYAASPDAISQEEAMFLEEMANDLAYGLESIRVRKERDVALEQLAQANAQIEEERAHLVDRVTERTTQLQMANHAKDSFLATMSHEIRTPLAGLLGMMELLGLSELAPKQAELLGAAQKSGHSLLRIVNDILDWSKIEAGKLELAPRAATILDMLKSVTSTYAQIASEKDIHLKIELDPELSDAYYFDPLRVSQILNNFTSNAIKFTERGTVRIRAGRIKRNDNGNETIRFSVQDNGLGISAEQQARLFRQYEQASAETARLYGGTGLGLAICRRLAELMDGALSVESAIGRGSTFSFTVDLPVAGQLEQDRLRRHSDDADTLDEAPDISPMNNNGKRISLLIVDDHPLNRMLLKQQLGMLGVTADAAADGAEALEKYQAGAYDLIITDCHMPEMDGYELTFRIRELEKRAGGTRIPIIAWTANVLAEESDRCGHAGMDDLLTKPTELADLRTMLVKWLVRPSAPQRQPAV
ncbi:MAG: GAF domain-containing protein [Gallionella sp.]|jgi:PAS domain S-box-containing protein|nr:GAF domain-containing protein [Gallionella sp.]